MAHDQEKRAFEAGRLVDPLLALAQAVGCWTVQCPEQGDCGYHELDLLSILEAVQSSIAIDVQPPVAGGSSYGVRTDRGVVCNKDLFALYTGMRMRELLEGQERIV